MTRTRYIKHDQSVNLLLKNYNQFPVLHSSNIDHSFGRALQPLMYEVQFCTEWRAIKRYILYWLQASSSVARWKQAFPTLWQSRTSPSQCWWIPWSSPANSLGRILIYHRSCFFRGGERRDLFLPGCQSWNLEQHVTILVKPMGQELMLGIQQQGAR